MHIHESSKMSVMHDKNATQIYICNMYCMNFNRPCVLIEIISFFQVSSATINYICCGHVVCTFNYSKCEICDMMCGLCI